MTPDTDSSEPGQPDDSTGQPFDPPGSVRMTAELHLRHSDERKPIVNHYLRGHRVGKGQHGEVWQCWDLFDKNKELALKAVKRNNPRAEKMNALRRRNLPASPHTPVTERLGSTEYKIRKEIAIMKKCRHGHIVRLVEVIDDKLNDRIYMVMEFLAGGEIKWRNSNHEPILQVDQARRICRDVILGLEYLHYQGIIHRDIKPANLLWTADRQMVKITDFGVSHFSYAQRLAAAGRGQAELDDSNDPILLDDSDLSKRAGTPPFLAPEVVSEYSSDSPAISHSATHTSLLSNKSLAQVNTSSTARPPSAPPKREITKAIDIWSFGVTLYCLLFGRVPFSTPESSEYILYNLICNQDWSVPETMGFDCIPTGGRHPRKSNTEGAVVIKLLDRLLEKDYTKRMTLDEIKRHPWFLRDIPSPQEWLRETSPSKNDIVTVTESDTRTAMSKVHFSWGWKKLTKLGSLLRTVRRPPGPPSSDRRGVQSTPATINRYNSTSSLPASSQISPRSHKKGKQRAIEGTPTIAVKGSKSKRTSKDSSKNSQAGSRRGSESLSVAPSQASSPTREDSGAGPYRPLLDDRFRHKFSLSQVKFRKSEKSTSQDSSPTDASGSTTFSHGTPVQAGPSRESLIQRSGDALRHSNGKRGSRQSETSGGVLTTAMRASSWGDPRSNSTHGYVEDVMSLHSGEHDIVDEEAMFFGAGGVSNEPPTLMSNLPIGLGQVKEPLSAVPLPLRQPQPERLLIGGNIASVPDPALHDSSSRQSQIRSTTTSPSPLARVAYGSEDDEDDYDSDDDDSMFFQNDNLDLHDEEVLAANTHQMFQEADDIESDGSGDEMVPIVVKRRRPSSASTPVAHPSSSDLGTWGDHVDAGPS